MSRLLFNQNNQVEDFTLILVRKDYYKIGVVQGQDVTFRHVFSEPDELSFKTYRPLDKRGALNWDRINDYNAIFVPEIGEHGEYFGIEVTLNEDNTGVYKTITGTGLAEEELDNTKIYNLEINTEAEREYSEKWGTGTGQYVTKFYRDPRPQEAVCEALQSVINGLDPSSKEYQDKVQELEEAEETLHDIKWFSLIHRVLDKADNYYIKHVDQTLLELTDWYQFNFNDVGIYTALTGEIAEQYHVHFEFDSSDRSISIYDLYSRCNNNDCNYRLQMKADRGIDTRFRGDFHGKCPYCGSTDVTPGYGVFTKIAVTKDNLLEAAQVSSNKDQLKNCFYVDGGDDMMRATVMNQNPNGSNYIYQFSDECKEEMPQELIDKIDAYNTEYDKYFVGNEEENKGIYTFTEEQVADYNEVVAFLQEPMLDGSKKFKDENIENYVNMSNKYVGYQDLTTLYYNTLDFKDFLQTAMVPDVETNNDSLEDTIQLIVAVNDLGTNDGSGYHITDYTSNYVTPVAVLNVETTQSDIVENAILKVINAVINTALYTVTAETTTWTPGAKTTDGAWVGNIIIKTIEYNGTEREAEGTAIIYGMQVTVTEEYTQYIKQTIDKMVARKAAKIKPLIDMTDYAKVAEDEDQLREFEDRLHCYSFDELSIAKEAYDDAYGQIISASNKINSLYKDMYFNRLELINQEMENRKDQIDAITEVLNQIEQYRKETKEALNFSNYLGERLWKVFCNYRREDTYKNDNYISDDLTNAQLIFRAGDLLDEAQKELYKASHLQYSVSGTLNNLLQLPEFAPIIDEFDVGNWIHMFVDEKKYDLRMLSYQINFDEKQTIDIEFSTVEAIWSGASDVKSVLEAAGSIAGSYSNIKQQVRNSDKVTKVVQGWFQDGIDATTAKLLNDTTTQNVVVDTSGILARTLDDLTGSYSPRQLRIVNNGLYTTEDNWEHINTGIGEFVFVDPEPDPTTGEMKAPEIKYGVIADTVVGKLIVGENLKIFSSNANMKMDDDGLTVKNADGNVMVSINPNASNVFTISQNDVNQFYVDNGGNINIKNASITAGALQSIDYSRGEDATYATTGMQVNLNESAIYTPNFSVIGNNVSLKGGTITAGTLQSSDYEYSDTNTYSTTGMQIDLTNKTIRTPNFTVDDTGKLYATGVSISGTLTADANSQIGPWTISNTAIYKVSATQGNASTGAAYFGNDGLSITDKFKVSSAGVLNATGATVSGILTATSGEIGGFALDSTSLHTKNVAVTSNAANSVALSSSTFTRTIGDTSRSSLKFAIGSNFGVTNDGTVYASNGVFSGAFKAGTTSMDSNGLLALYSSGNRSSRFVIWPASGGNTGINLSMSNDWIYMGNSTSQRWEINKIGIYFQSGAYTQWGNDPLPDQYCIYKWATSALTVSSVTVTNIKAPSKDVVNISTDATQLVLGKNGSWLRPNDDNGTDLGHENYRWSVVYAKQGTINTSDRKDKDSFTSIDYAHDLIMNLKPTTYMWKKGDHRRTRMGFIAQEVAETCNDLHKNLALVTASYKIDPELGEDDPNLTKDFFGEKVDDELLVWGLSYHELIAPMVQVIQDQDKELKQLRQELDELKATL